ncbi:MAG: transcriptional repressor [Lachnospiraceae bacterium]|nr:transcriptional repressor [Lachnospiraceae bacterium]
MAVQKYSRQREEIRKHLFGRTDHPTAETIYTEIRMENPKISLGTVYRNLAQLESAGEVIRIPVTNGPDHFDGNTNEHYHLICPNCGSVSDLWMDGVRRELHKGLEAQRLDADQIILNVYGCCSNCNGKLQAEV